MDVTFRPTTTNDYKFVRTLLDSAGLGGEWLTSELFERLIARNVGLYWIAESEGRVIGSVFANHDGGYYGYIYKLVVDESHRRQGVGRGLLQQVLNTFSEIGIDWSFGLVRKDNSHSIELFRNEGFEIGDGHYFVNTFHQLK